LGVKNLSKALRNWSAFLHPDMCKTLAKTFETNITTMRITAYGSKNIERRL